MYMVNNGCFRRSLAGGRSSRFTSRQRRSRSFIAGGIWSGMGGGALAEAIWKVTNNHTSSTDTEVILALAVTVFEEVPTAVTKCDKDGINK